MRWYPIAEELASLPDEADMAHARAKESWYGREGK
jgi:hypothetical protein